MKKITLMIVFLLCLTLTGDVIYAQEQGRISQGNLSYGEGSIESDDFSYLEMELRKVENGGSTGNRKGRINSRGNINYNNGQVLFSAADFIYLAEEIDLMERQFKVNIVNELNGINTYFKADGNVVYDSSGNEMITDEQKIQLSMENILAGIRKSQSIDSVSSIQAVDQIGNALFYKDEAAKNKGELLSSTTVDTGFPVYYQEVTAQNMSAGTAAWVNGMLIRGNGADNKVSWENGYREGYSQGLKESLDNLELVYHYHQHEGEESTEGGCYGKLTGKTPVKCGCSSYAYTEINGQATCEHCGHNHGSSKCTAVITYNSYTYIGLVCGKTEETIESVTIQY